jgi:hypothetical protein
MVNITNASTVVPLTRLNMVRLNRCKANIIDKNNHLSVLILKIYQLYYLKLFVIARFNEKC